MILRILKGNEPFHFVLVPGIVAAFWLKSIRRPETFPFFEGENSMPLYQPVHDLLSGLPLVNTLASLFMVILLSFLILRMNTVYDFIQIRTFLPTNIFVLIISGVVSLHTLHPVYFGALFLLFCIDSLFGTAEGEKRGRESFKPGFYLSMGSLFYLNLIFYFPIVWIAFFQLRKQHDWRDFVMSLISIALPWFYVFSWYFFTGSPAGLYETLWLNIFTSNHFFQSGFNFMYVYIAFLMLITLWCSFFMLGQYNAKKSSTRKYFKILFLILTISVVLFFLIPAASEEILVIMAVPLTFLFSNYLIALRSQFAGNVFMYIFIALVIWLQFY